MLAAVAKREQALRSARAEGKKGFAGTPGFLHAVVCDALSGVQPDAPIVSHAGFADVGAHTNSEGGRDTAWPLVRSALQVRSEGARRAGLAAPGTPTRHVSSYSTELCYCIVVQELTQHVRCT